MSSSSSSLGRNSMIMAAGTAASRVTGQVRTILLAAALGTTGMAANAYQAGAMIPQAVFTLVSGGIFNAVLVPQIVRTLQQKDAEERLNKLITLAIAMLGGITLIMAAATPLLTMLYVRGTPEMMALTNAFTLWCMPQIFFYGLYTVLGQILAAKDHFGTYAWSSVGANLISCAGFTAFILLFGRSTEQPVAFWTANKLALTAGTWTLGVAFQALILFLPLTRCGIRYRPRFGVAGIGLKSMGSVAGWSVGIVILDQLVNIITTNITTSAPDQAHATMGLNMLDVAGNATYQNAFTLYMLPYSLIAVSVATALFPKISRAIADHDIPDARDALSQSLRSVGALMVFFTVAFIVMPVPIILALLPSVSVKEAMLIATPLTMLGLGLPVSSAYLIIQRTFYAFEDGRTPFLFMLLFNAMFVVLVLGGAAVTSPTMWVAIVGVGSAVGHLLAFPFLIPSLRRRFEGRLDGRRILASYGKAIVAGSAAVIVGVLLRRPVYALLGVMSSADRAAAGSRDAAAADGGHAAGMADVMSMNWFQAVGTCVLLTIAITATYLIALWLLRSRELIELARPLLARVTRRDNAASDGPDAAEHAVSDSTVQVPSTPPAPPAQSDRPAPDTALHSASQAAPASRSEAAAAPPSSTTPTVRMAPKPAASGPQSAQSQQSHQSSRYGANMKPQLGDTIINRYTLVSQLREAPGLLAWRASDRVLTRDCQLFIVTDSKVLSQVNSTAASLALMRDPRFTQVLQLQHDERIAIVVTQLDAGLSLSEYLRGPAGHILSFDAIRSIMGELTSAINMLLSQGLEHRAISTDTVRISTMGVQLADIPVSAMMADLTGGDPKLNDESLAVRQLAGVLYALLTHTPSVPGTTYDLGRIGDDVPGEFKLICKRGLGLRYDSEDRDLPMSSLAEIDALLGPWTPLNKLHERDIALPGVAGAETITNGVLSDVDPEDIMDVPSGVVSRVAMPPLAMEMPQYASALTSDDVVDVTPLAGDFFRAFDGSQSSSTVNNTTLSLDVSSIRHDAHHGVDAGAGAGAGVSGEATTVQPPVDPIAAAAASSMPTVQIETHPQHPHAEPVATPVAPVPNVADTEEEGEKTMIIPPVNAPKPPSLPPAAAKVPYVNQIYKIESQDNDVSDEALLGSLPTKIVAIVVSIAVVVAAGYFAIQALNNDSTGNITNGSSNSADPWSQQNIDQVPFGNSTNGQSGSSDEDSSESGSSGSGSSDKSSGSSSSDKSSSASSGSSSTKNTADKEAKKVPEPKYENNTPLTISSQNFQTNPGGQNGFAFSLHLDQPHKVYRMTITITSSGGTGYVRANTTGDPTKGEEVAKFSFAEGGTTEVKFDKVVTAQDLILWVPMDSMPGNQLYIQKVELF